MSKKQANGKRKATRDFYEVAETIRGERGAYVYVTSRPKGKRQWTAPLVIGLN